MGLPAVVLGLWGYRAYRGYRSYRAVQAARHLAEAAEQLATPVATGTAVLSTNQSIEQAQSEAEAEGDVTTDWCATCEDPNCRDQGEKIRQRVEELKSRYNDMLRDEQNLFQNHYDIGDALYLDGVKIGSWVGHLMQYDAKQRNLAKLLRDYKDMGCPELSGDEVEEWATRPPPDGPATG